MAILPTYRKEFKGYTLDRDGESLPTDSGVYMMYRCVPHPETRTVDLVELFYIGKATDLKQEIMNHKRRAEFLAQAKQGEEICYSYAFVSRVQYDVVENGLVYMQKPRLNDKLKWNYNHQDAEFHFSGACALLKYNDYKIVDKVIIPL